MYKLGMGLPSPEKTFIQISIWNAVAAQLRLVPAGLASFANLSTSLKRIQEFFEKEDLENYIQDLTSSVNAVELSDATLKWSHEQECLKNINLTVPKGKIVAITGSVGSGKTSILGALTRVSTRSRSENCEVELYQFL